MAQQKGFFLLPLAGLLAACGDGPSQPPPPLPSPSVGFIDPSPVALIAGEGGKEIPAQVTSGASCTVAVQPATLTATLPSGCSPVLVAAPLGVEGTFTVTLTAQLNGKIASAQQTVTAERRRMPTVQYPSFTVYLGTQTLPITAASMTDVQECSGTLVDGVKHNDALIPAGGLGAFTYTSPDDTVTGGKRYIRVVCRHTQIGSVPDTTMVEVRLTTPVATLNPIAEKLCPSGRVTEHRLTANAPSFLRSTRRLMRLAGDSATPADALMLSTNYISGTEAVIYLAWNGNANVPVQLVYSVSNNGTTWEATQPMGIDENC